MKYIIILILILIGCVTSNDSYTSTGEITTRYIDGCYYLITPQGGITLKASSPCGCKE